MASKAESECIEAISGVAERNIEHHVADIKRENPDHNLIAFLRQLAAAAARDGETMLQDTILEIVSRSTLDKGFGGYGLSETGNLNKEDEANVIFLCRAYMQAYGHQKRAETAPRPLTERPAGRPGMTLTEKIFAAHDVSRRGFVRPHEVVQVDVDWCLASELSWSAIEGVYDDVGSPGIFRNDRFWLAGDHRVEPELYEEPKVKALMKSSLRAQRDFKMTDFQGFNYSILHTEFVRERAQPGMLCVGADSHTCSAGAVSCLAIGMGATDVCMPLITGQTWFSVPETVNIRLVGSPPKGVGGKDTILYILGEFKRNTVAADRVVEFTGPGLQHLTCDARFAIANMCTEFGAVTGIFEGDGQTATYIEKRAQKKHKEKAIFYKPDEDAQYAERYTVDLSKVESFVARYPSPDDVVPVSELTGKKLDGCFIGACTTAEEDLIIGALVLDQCFKQGKTPASTGRRLVVPGSRPIQHKLERHGLLDIYRRANFKIGVPGCSMCIGQGMDRAFPDEVWLSSQNRNFKNRMGPGSIGNICSAATVAASSFDMQVTNPQPYLEALDMDLVRDILGRRAIDNEFVKSSDSPIYSEPPESTTDDSTSQVGGGGHVANISLSNVVQGKVLTLGDFVDTDAIIPSKFLAGSKGEADLGSHCMEFFMPEFREKVKSGLNVVVAGRGFGVGSSRQEAVTALRGAGVQCVIAKSFAFIYARNQPNAGFLGFIIQDDAFFELAKNGADIEIDLASGHVLCGGQKFAFTLSSIEKQLIAAGGMTEAFKRFGKEVWNVLCQSGASKPRVKTTDIEDLKS